MSSGPSDASPFRDDNDRWRENAYDAASESSQPVFSQFSPPPIPRGMQVDELLLSRFAQEEAEERARRLKFLDKGLFGEPAWDILLDVYVNEVTGLRASVGDACIAAGGSEATALRVVRMLEAKGLLDRASDKRDRRRQWVTISHHGYDVMTQYLKGRAAARFGRPFIHNRPNHRIW